MASVEKRNRDGKVTWQARWRDPSGAQRKRSFGRKVDAERYLVGVGARLLDDSYADPGRSRVTVAEWSEQWLAGQHHLKPSTRASYESVLRCHILPTWGRVPLSAVTHADVIAWTAELTAKCLAPASVRQTHRVFSLLLALAVRDERLSRNPADKVKLPRARISDKRFLTHAQVAELADAAGDYKLAVKVLAYCGLRFGELAALRVSSVDLMRRRLQVSQSVTEINGRAVFGTPKSHLARSVPIPRTLAGELALHMAGKALDAFVFPAPCGGVLRNGNFRRRAFDPAVRSTGLDGLTPHDLRHTAASLAVSAGANVKAVQRLLGHASAAVTLDVYSGLFDDDLDAVAERLDEAAAVSHVPQMCPEAAVTPLTLRDTGS